MTTVVVGIVAFVFGVTVGLTQFFRASVFVLQRTGGRCQVCCRPAGVVLISMNLREGTHAEGLLCEPCNVHFEAVALGSAPPWEKHQ